LSRSISRADVAAWLLRAATGTEVAPADVIISS
jgi:hypothetical protein